MKLKRRIWYFYVSIFFNIVYIFRVNFFIEVGEDSYYCKYYDLNVSS